MIKINDFTLQNGSSPFIVAEAGINHNGDIHKAFEMIEVAKNSGVQAIKFQTFHAEEFVGDPTQTYTYMSQGIEVTESMLEMFKRHEFSNEQWKDIKRKCDSDGIMFLSTPQNESDLNLLLEIGIPAIKVGSDDFTNLPLLKRYSRTNLPLLVSCGMSNFSEVFQALETIGTFSGYPTVLLLCTSQYPTPAEDVNLLKLQTLAGAFPDLTLGFSDHTQGVLASSLAVAYGACFFEKHFTLDKNLPGPDHWFSEDPVSLKEWVCSINLAYQMKGSGLVKPTASEEKMKILARRSILTLKEINKGEKLTKENIGLRRPGNGLPPSFFNQVLGMTSTKSLKNGKLLRLGDVG